MSESATIERGYEWAREYYARQFDLSPEMVASKQLMRHIIDENAAEAPEMVRLLNENRKREPIRTAEFASCLEKARRDAPEADAPNRLRGG